MTNPLVGKTITAIYLASDREAIRFDLADGTRVVARCDADCCSHTWIETVENPEDILDSPVLEAGDVEMPDLEYDHERFEYDHERFVRFYGFKIRTARGEMLLDYRNESNGYYGGSLVWPGDDFYGGVYGQNISNEDWQKIAG